MFLKLFKKQSILGGAFLISGSCIGAGMLALPIITGMSGFIPSIILILISWFFMTFTGLLLLEVNGWFIERSNIISMSGRSFGVLGRILSWVFYLFLFYSLSVAYISGGGNILSSSIGSIFSVVISSKIYITIFVVVSAFIVYLGTSTVDFLNRIFMCLLFLSYLGIVFLGLTKIKIGYLSHVNFSSGLIAIPILITSFGFHNMIPSLVSYMENDYKKVKKSIILGGLIALGIYLIWEFFVLGIVSYSHLFSGFAKGSEASQILMTYLDSTWVGFFVKSFAFFAIITSFLAQTLGLTHFIADGLRVFPNKKNRSWLVLLAIIPPSFFAITYPTVFFKALSFAGGFCAVCLFCILPALMVWNGRYYKQYVSSYMAKGGKIALVLVILFSLFILGQELFRIFS